MADAELIRAWDVELQATGEGWVASRLDTRRPARLFGLIRRSAGHPSKDWKAFEPLIGHTPSVLARANFGRVGRLKPTQIADLLEGASSPEVQEILDVVHADPELEADVFEELRHPTVAEAGEQGEARLDGCVGRPEGFSTAVARQRPEGV